MPSQAHVSVGASVSRITNTGTLDCTEGEVWHESSLFDFVGDPDHVSIYSY